MTAFDYMKDERDTLVDYILLLLETNKWYLEKLKSKSTDPFQEEAYSIAVIVNAWAALEGYINNISSVAKFASKLESYEKGFLEEVDWRMGESGRFEKYVHYQQTTKKFLFLLKRFSKVDLPKVKNSKLWNDLKSAEVVRNMLIHPKDGIRFKTLKVKEVEGIDNTVRSAIILLRDKVMKVKHPRVVMN